MRTEYAALHLSLRMSRQMLPWWSTLGWKHGVSKRTAGALNGYSAYAFRPTETEQRLSHAAQSSCICKPWDEQCPA